MEFLTLAPVILKLILQFVIGLCVGIYGYLVPGYINLSVLQLGVSKNLKAIRITLLIISLIEIPYCFLCMSGMHWLMQQHMVLLIIKWLLFVMLLVLSVLSFVDGRKKHSEINLKGESMDHTQIKKLLFFAVFNPFQLSAWVIWGGYFIEKDWFEWTSMPILLFSIGASIGVFLILWVYAFAGEKLVTYFSMKRKYIDYSVAGILFFLACLQLYRNLKGGG